MDGVYEISVSIFLLFIQILLQFLIIKVLNLKKPVQIIFKNDQNCVRIFLRNISNDFIFIDEIFFHRTDEIKIHLESSYFIDNGTKFLKLMPGDFKEMIISKNCIEGMVIYTSEKMGLNYKIGNCALGFKMELYTSCGKIMTNWFTLGRIDNVWIQGPYSYGDKIYNTKVKFDNIQLFNTVFFIVFFNVTALLLRCSNNNNPIIIGIIFSAYILGFLISFIVSLNGFKSISSVSLVAFLNTFSFCIFASIYVTDLYALIIITIFTFFLHFLFYLEQSGCTYNRKKYIWINKFRPNT